MTTNFSSLADLEAISYLDEAGQVPDRYNSKVGVYAIFNQNHQLQYVGYSRDVGTSLKQHLVRQPDQCYWVKVETIDRPSRTMLEEIRTAWISENGTVPPGNDQEQTLWEQAIDAKAQMTPDEQAAYEKGDELGKIKTLKQVARRVEQERLMLLEARGVKMAIRFDPKAKEEGRLDLK
ncbi:MAG TPA: GIY-YIG nuclease family protein [Allocoleopsis sp.]